MDKTYNASKVEDKIYNKWEKRGYFNPDNCKENPNSNKTFTIMLPPPNVTGVLHLGHAATFTIQDILVRYKRMQGFKTLWVPGTDHAAIATQNVVEKQLALKDKTREGLGRNAFIDECWKWTNKSHNTIVTQTKKVGASLDWSRERFTLDEGITLAVYTAFSRMYNDGLIYKGPRIINWCSSCKSTLADDEVDHKDVEGAFYYIKYQIKDSDDFIEIATTRPETLLGDTAVAVNPTDERYKDVIGKTVIVPIIGREIKIIGDEYVDKTTGTGALKVTPAHDPNDYALGKKHNLEFINILNNDGTLNENAGEDFIGMTITDAREKVVAKLQRQGLLSKTESITHSVGHCYRCSTIIEPLISEQWFIDVNKKIASLGNKSLKDVLKEAVELGEIEIIPKRFDKTYFQWIDNLKDWCISRQIWWGHRLPVYTCPECGEITVAPKKPKNCPHCGCDKLKQDEDTLDTWFSSALWPFATLGWPNENFDDFKNFYPNTVLATGYDIIFFWVARMIMMGKYLTGKYPFKKVYLNGLVCDKSGQKMSKSKGNGIDPMEIIKTYGADAVRLSLVIGTTPGNNVNIYDEKISGYRNFINKLWNVARFVIDYNEIFDDLDDNDLMQLQNPRALVSANELNLADNWILNKNNEIIEKVTSKLESYRIGEAGEILYDFVWRDFADWYIEIFKNKEYGCQPWVLRYVLINTLKLLHPFAPFITEYLWSIIFRKDKYTALINADWPTVNTRLNNTDILDKFDTVKDIVSSIRNIRAEYNIDNKARLNTVIIDNPEISLIADNAKVIKELAGIETIKISKQAPSEDSYVKIVCDTFEIYLELTKKELDEISRKNEKEIKFLQDSIKAIEAKLNQKNFLEKAPKEIVEKEQEKYKSFKQRLEKLQK